MGVNKVEFGGQVLIDLTGDSVTEGTLEKGYTAHNAQGEVVVGKASLVRIVDVSKEGQ